MTLQKDGPAEWQKEHDHLACIEDAVSRARQVCLDKGVRLTPMRQRILELVWQSHKPVGAYALLDEIKPAHKSAAPPTIYRALDFLMAHGLVYRIQSLNAYVGCNDPGHIRSGIILICNGCGEALEVDEASISDSIAAFTKKLGFEVSSQAIEAKGVCPNCQV